MTDERVEELLGEAGRQFRLAFTVSRSSHGDAMANGMQALTSAAAILASERKGGDTECVRCGHGAAKHHAEDSGCFCDCPGFMAKEPPTQEPTE